MKYKEKEKSIETVPEFLPNEYFSVISLKRAVWQYLIDHSKIVNDRGEGRIRFLFYIQDEGQFWWRVRQRDEGKFKRIDLVAFNENAIRKERQIEEWRIKAKKYDKELGQNIWWAKRIEDKKINGKWWERTIMKFASFLNKTSRSINTKMLKFKK